MSEPTYDEIHAEAMRIWREREDGFPAFTRRMKPDDLDHRSGAWGHIFAMAKARLSGPLPAPATPQDGEAP